MPTSPIADLVLPESALVLRILARALDEVPLSLHAC